MRYMLTLISLLFVTVCTYANVVDFESLVVGDQWGSPVGTPPGTVIFVEDGIPVSVHGFDWTGGGGTFNFCQVDVAFSGFGNCLNMNTNNINLLFDFDLLGFPVNYVTFDFADLGGNENIAVNGEPIFAGELVAAPIMIAPDVMLTVITMPMPGGKMGKAALKGNIHKLLLGGQEFWIDNVRAEHRPIHCVDFESVVLHKQYGSPVGNSPGDLIFVQNGIPVSIHDFDWGTGTGTFNFCQVDMSFSGFGFNQIMQTNNINLKFNFTELPFIPNLVTFEFIDLGGMENISVNGVPLYVGELTTAPILIAPCVTMNIVSMDVGGTIIHFATLRGPVESLLIGGQEFWLDNICASFVNHSCVDFEPLTPGTVYGSPAGYVPGDHIFAQNAIPVSIHDFNHIGGGTSFNFCKVDLAFSGFGKCLVMLINNINLLFDFNCLGFIPNKVSFEFADLGGYENIAVNGAPIFIGELTTAPINIAPDVKLTIVTTPIPGGKRGKGTLEGPVHDLLLGGQEFFLDNICAKDSLITNVYACSGGESAVPNSIELAQNYPNPFNPETTIRFKVPNAWYAPVTLQIFNTNGQLVTTLIDRKKLKTGIQEVQWNGRDSGGKLVSSGIYIYKINSNNIVLSKKMLFMK